MHHLTLLETYRLVTAPFNITGYPVLSVCAISDICHRSLCYLCVLSATYIIVPCAISDICHRSLCYLCVLSATYIIVPCAICVCYLRHMSSYLVLSVCAICDICHRTLCYLCAICDIMSPWFYQFEFRRPNKHSCGDFHTIFHDVTQRE